MSAIVNARRLLTLVLVTLLGSAAGITGANEQKVNPELLELQLIQKPLLRKLGARVYGRWLASGRLVVASQRVWEAVHTQSG